MKIWPILLVFFDGEGSITITINGHPSPRGLAPNHTLQVSIGNTDPCVLIWLQKIFGGGLSYREGAKPHHRIVAQWCVRAARALPFLKAIRPFIWMKKDQVDVAINYQETKKRGPKRVSEETIAWREEQRKKIMALNRMVHIDEI